MDYSHEHSLDLLVDDAQRFSTSLPTEPVVFRQTAMTLSSLLNLEKIDDFLATVPLRFPFLEVTKDNQRLSADQLTYGAAANDRLLAEWIDPVLVSEALADGATLFFNLLDRSNQDVGDFCRSLSRSLGTGVSATAFVTPPASRGFDRHHDRVSSFIVQLEGEKHWDIWAPAIPFPLSDYHPWQPENLTAEDRHRIYDSPPVESFSLHTGDVLWLPRGWVHNVYSEHVSSLHLTLGIPDVTPHTLVRLIVDLLSTKPELRHDLPLNFWQDPATRRQVAEDTRALIMRHIASLDGVVLGERLKEEMLAQMLPSRIRPTEAALGLRKGPSDRVVLLVDHIPLVCRDAEQTTLHLGDREFTLQAGAAKVALDEAIDTPDHIIDGSATAELGELVSALLQQGIARSA